MGFLLFNAAMAHDAFSELGAAIENAEEAIQEFEDLIAAEAASTQAQVSEWGRDGL